MAAVKKAENPHTPRRQKGKTYNLRVNDAMDRLINDARSVLGQKRTEFMLTAAKIRAQEVLLSRTNFVLSDEQWAAFQADLEDDTPPTPEMIALHSRIPAWER